MANLSLVTSTVLRVVESREQLTGIAAEAISLGNAVRLDTSTGKITKSNGSTAAEGRFYGIALRTAAAGEAVTVLRRGVIDGFDLSALNYDADVYLSDTDGSIADTPDTQMVRVGRVIPGFATTLGTAADKLLAIDPDSGGRVDTFNVTYNLLTGFADQAVFTATQACRLVAVAEVHATAGNDAGAVNLQVTKDTGTAAPGAGTDLLTNNTNAGFNLKGTANTVQNGTLTPTDADVTLAAGDRLSLDFAGTLTTLAGVQVTLTLRNL